ncbi:Tripeptidyl-peptidase sed2 [Daldinia childiae]|uniref:Tripeptidyl-peptidase sed2 n=1 Tax=Daldinia childiae TaxID=326645 RepID=UPI001446D1E4|nr:Tripeptidyl-peptidase sed2 [Daldinia childiae]KAF3064043.1 Tripeptidyl-peptidase sed2 [Daldinia childiae]
MRSLFLLFASAATAKVMDSLTSVPKGWAEVRPASPNDPVTLRVGLKQQHAAALEQAVIEISTPGHPNYGMHLSRDEVRAYTAPTKRSVSSVADWLTKSGVESTVNNDWITFKTDVKTANDLLGANFAWYQYEKGGSPKLRTLSYSVPDELAGSIDLIQPTTRFGQLGAKRSTIFEMQLLEPEEENAVKTDMAVNAADCNPSRITPACLKSLYNIKYTAPTEGNLVAFSSYLEEYARYSDLQSFESQYLTQAKGQNFSVELVNGGLDDQSSSDDSGEANLDVQYVLAISSPIPIKEYSTGGRGPLEPTHDQPGPSSNEPYLEFLTYLLDQDDSTLPQTLSTSYGEEEQSVPAEYALKVCNLFMQLGARGVSVLFSSGDSGPGDSCIRESDQAPYFQPSFPAGCPYVTSVGATYNVAPEQGVSFSSGGFSSLHAQPAWQADSVNSYLKSIGQTYSAYFNSSNRGFPDVAAQGSRFIVIDKGRSALLSGTSASSPVFAGVVALLNAARKSQGQPPLGFLNPWLYNNSAALIDITSGYGSGCSGNSAFRNGARWNATAGWDPVTGLGTPDFGKLLAAAAPGVENA